MKVFTDAGKSGTSRKGRTAFQEAIDYVIDNDVKYFIVTETDRFARNSSDHKQIKNLLNEAGCKLVALNQSFTESDEPESELMDGFVSEMNQYYSRVISIKTKRGMKAKVASGGWPGPAKPGYLNIAIADGDKVRRVIQVDETKRHLIEEAFRLYATGNYNHTVLNTIMFDKGLRSKSGKKMAKSKFIKMLGDEFYIGKIKYKGKVQEKNGNHEALIDDPTFKLCQEVKNQHNQNANRERKHSEKFFLRHILRCGICQGKVTAELHEKKNMAYYHCSLTKKKHSNVGQNIRSDELEKLIANEFSKLEFTAPLMKKIAAKANDILDQTHSGIDRTGKAINNRITRLKTRRQNVETDRADRVIDSDTYQRMSEDIRVELGQLQKQLEDLEQKREGNIDTFSRLMVLTDDLHQTYTKAAPDLKKHLISLFFKAITILDKEISNIEYTEIIAALLKSREVIISDRWLGRRDSNPRMLAPEASALPLGDSPI